MALTKATYSMIEGAPVNVLDYGADPTGITDSTAAINAALTSGTKFIVFPQGTYVTTGGHSSPAELTIVGQGAKIKYSDTFLTATDVTYLSVSGFDFEDTKVGLCSAILVNGASGENFFIERNIFRKGAPSISFSNYGGQEPIFEYAVIRDNIWYGGGTGSFCSVECVQNLVISGNQGQNGAEFIDVNNGNVDVVVTNNTAKEFTDNVIDVNYVRQCVISGNIIASESTTCTRPLQVTQYSGSVLPDILASDKVIISDNVVTALFSQYGFAYTCAVTLASEKNSRIAIHGNIFTQLTGSTGTLAYVNTQSYVNITGNMFYNGQLNIYGNNKQFVCNSNTFLNATIPLRIDFSNGGTVVGNLFDNCAAASTSDGVVFPTNNSTNVNVSSNTFTNCTGTYLIRCGSTTTNIKSNVNLGVAAGQFAGGGGAGNTQVTIA